jgi:hypothetical protein
VKGHIMAKQTINIGSSANDGTGDPLRTAFDKVNDNFNELYSATGAGSGQNISISGQSIISDNSNGNIQLDPNGTGEIVFLGNTSHGDSIKAQFGDADDLQIYHDGGNSLIDDVGTGALVLRSDTEIRILKRTGNEYMVVATPDGAVSLYYDNSKKIETTAAGVDVTGDLNVDTINTGGDTLSVSASTTTFTGNVTVAAGQNLEAGFIRVDSNIALQGNKIQTQLSNSDIDMDPSGTGTINFRVPTQSTVGAAGGASALPATPTGYAKFKIGDTEYVIPYYAVS